MDAKFRIFKATFKSWETMCEEATAFVTRIGRERVISISHAADENKGTIIVWYWSDRAGEH